MMKKFRRVVSKVSSTDWVAIAILGFGILGIFILPYLVTQKSWGYELNVTKSNEIGDTLGGILSPFIGLMSAFLVYLALREQIKANKLLSEEINRKDIEKYEIVIFNRVEKKFKVLVQELKDFIPFESSYFGEISNTPEKLRIDSFRQFYNLKHQNNTNYPLFLCHKILYDYENLEKFDLFLKPLLVILNKLIYLLEQVNDEIKVQKHLKKEVEYIFEVTFGYYEFYWNLHQDFKEKDFCKHLFQLQFLKALIKFSRLFERLKIDFDEKLSTDFDNSYFMRYNLNANIEKEIDRRLFELGGSL